MTDENKFNDLEKKSQEFNSELGTSLERIEKIINYYKESPERISSNTKEIGEVCNLFYGLRLDFQERYGFDFGMYESRKDYSEPGKPKEEYFYPSGKTNGIDVESKIIGKYKKLFQEIAEINKKRKEASN